MKQFPDNLLLRAFAPDVLAQMKTDRALYQLQGPFTFESTVLGKVTVPLGFLTDFASIPRAALWYIDDDDPGILFASIIHDFLYKQAGQLEDGRKYTREGADMVLREGMQVCGARKDQCAAVYAAVRLFGGSHWNTA
ncbi:MAG: DUF1353 domain-containing protein [Proteobacteria bacterium]|nr:DUF1353 domain-containing protein [Pseudomonadota bacterium]